MDQRERVVLLSLLSGVGVMTLPEFKPTPFDLERLKSSIVEVESISDKIPANLKENLICLMTIIKRSLLSPLLKEESSEASPLEAELPMKDALAVAWGLVLEISNAMPKN